MEVGIVSYGVYLPRYRLSNKTLAEAWRRPADLPTAPAGQAGKSEKAVANFDEDSLTLAAESCFNALDGSASSPFSSIPSLSRDNFGGARPDSLSFASTTFPYQEKLSASIISTLLDLPESTRVQDFAHSLRSGTMALIKASEDLKAGYSKLSLVTAADCRTARPGSDSEPFIGDGSASLLLGTENIIARIIESFSISSDFTDIWRKDTDTYLNSGDIRFGQEVGYTRLMESAIQNILRKTNLKPSDFAKVILTPRDPRSHLGLAQKLGFNPKTQLQNDLTQSVGFAGTAHPLLLLIAALEESKPKDKILLASYGDGSDAMILEVTEEIKKIQDKKLFQTALTRRKELTSYTKFLEFRELLKGQPKIAAEAFTSLIMQHREQDIMMQLKAKKCQKCQMILTLRQKVCSQCGAIDKQEIPLFPPLQKGD